MLKQRYFHKQFASYNFYSRSKNLTWKSCIIWLSCFTPLFIVIIRRWASCDRNNFSLSENIIHWEYWGRDEAGHSSDWLINIGQYGAGALGAGGVEELGKCYIVLFNYFLGDFLGKSCSYWLLSTLDM